VRHGRTLTMPDAPASQRAQLRSIARRAMIERGLLQEFSAAANAETAALTSAIATSSLMSAFASGSATDS